MTAHAEMCPWCGKKNPTWVHLWDCNPSNEESNLGPYEEEEEEESPSTPA
jgi:hypothetical protein